jgi:hypothetical protein
MAKTSTPVLRDNEGEIANIDHAIRRVAPLLGRVAAALRRSPDAAILGRLIEAGKITDPDNLGTLAALITGLLNMKRGDRGPKYKWLNDAVRDVRALAWSKGTPRAHTKAVASRYGVDPAVRLTIPNAAEMVVAALVKDKRVSGRHRERAYYTLFAEARRSSSECS